MYTRKYDCGPVRLNNRLEQRKNRFLHLWSSTLLSKGPAEEEDSMTCPTTIPSWRQCAEIKRQECKLCVLSNLTKYQIFVCHTFYHFNSSAVLSPLENLLSFEFVYWTWCVMDVESLFVTALCASTLIEISMQGRGGMEHKKNVGLDPIVMTQMTFCMFPLPLS